MLIRRPEGRAADAVRPISIETGIQRNAAGSVLIATGGTRVICAASVSEGVPPWMRNSGRGWVTAEYSMLPGSSGSRISRKQGGRDKEIQRLIGRSLRGVIDFEAISGFTITLDCDVLEADGGTRTASITGGWVALHLALRSLYEAGRIPSLGITDQVAAISAGICGGVPLLDLDYPEDSTADVDMNIVGTADGKLIEVQGTAEGEPFSRAQMDALLDLAEKGIAELVAAQRRVLSL